MLVAVALSVRVQKTVRAPLQPAWVRGVLQRAATEPAVAAAVARLTEEPDLTLRIVGSRAMRRLHRAFFDDPAETDVLSFPSGTAGRDGYLGDLAVCWPAVLRQAARYGHDPGTEAALLSVHGLLHLLGWDHATPPAEAEMTALALAALARSGVHPAMGRLPER
ncbi:MAG: rRNA maturation RNase YbeY [Candidatus Dormibacteraceae bacterium]